MGGKDADTVDFVTARPSRTAHTDEEAVRDAVPSPVTEVGYALRQNDENGEWLELWRREDWMVDDDPTGGGKYTLVYDRIRRFNLLYFPIPEQNVEGKGSEEWDTRLQNSLPYAIVLDIEFDVEGATGGEDEEAIGSISRIITLKGAYNVKPAAPPGQGTPPPAGG